ncbi:MAG TPA: AAA domain-containing protein [Archangium sp.]|uniref:DEAD/DEAH box helicase n=1 Tax=Archangium sp. TaxID=1872627 RepID=UPI002E35D86A|nr:AAA domain-containing protein [Archangium sp.]HEX5749776.1 AAA domain-containing protein [Archangium sp.]
MRVDELRGGLISSVEVKPVTGRFDPVLARRGEVELQQTVDEVVLRWREYLWPVTGVDSRRHEALLTHLSGNLPMVAWAAHTSPEQVTVQLHAFTRELRFGTPITIGIDDAALEELRVRFRVGGGVPEVAQWLEQRLLLDTGGLSYRRAVISGGPQGADDAFRIFGNNISVDVRRQDDRLRVQRVIKGGRMDAAVLQLLCAPLSFTDLSSTAELASGARHALEEAVRADDSYLRIWTTYNELEREAILRRARAVGAIPYDRCEQRRDGGWRFVLANVDELESRLATLLDSDRFELEAGERPPTWDNLESSVGKERGQRRLSAPLSWLDTTQRRLDLRAPEDDEDQPLPPPRGFLYLSLAGDRTRLKRRETAEQKLRTGTSPMPRLGLLLEGRPATQPYFRRRSAESPAVLQAFGGKPTGRQREALNVALNTPDIAVIQGPPGTGKTKVIAALQRRLAELAEKGEEVSHRILVSSTQHDAVENVVQRSEVFGLPPVKVGSRRGDDGAVIDAVEKFRVDRIERLRAKLREAPESERNLRARRIAVACLRAPVAPEEMARHLRELEDVLGELLPPKLHDRLQTRIAELTRPVTQGDLEEHELRLAAAKGIRVDAVTFEDDGPAKARKALLRLESVLSPAEADFLRRCAEWTEPSAPSWLEEGQTLKEALEDRLLTPPAPTVPTLDEQTQALLIDVINTVERQRQQSASGEDSALAAYLEDLENDPLAVQQALEHYTVVLAATCQQAAGRPMQLARGIDVGSVTFESVIVDEAARANPLDLFIPMSMARRRVVLVGDHRQLPHMLEPDVERELASAVEKGDIAREAQDALKHSLFERLWLLLKQLEDQDGIPRTVTLDMQFRMHPVLGDFVSRMFYERWGDGCVSSGGKPEDFAHTLPGYMKGKQPCVAAWLDVPGGPGRWERRGQSKSRPSEARRIARELRRLIEVDPRLTFGIITFYSAQVDEIGEALVHEGLAEPTNSGGWRIADAWRRTENHHGEFVERLRVGTVDAFQGKEFDVVFLSVTRSNEFPAETDEQLRRKYGHLLLDNRLCVGMSRQHRLLVVAGDRDFIRDAEPLLPLREFLTMCEGPHGVVLP